MFYLLNKIRDIGMPKTRVSDMRIRNSVAPPANPDQIAQFTNRLREHRNDGRTGN